MKIKDGMIEPETGDVDAEFIEAANSGENIFLTGMAGTGKTTLLRKFLDQTMARVDITAPTGVAALNVGGTTIHRWCGMMLGPQGDTTNEDYYRWLQDQPYRSIRRGFDRVRWCQTLVIDEISMLPGRQLEFIEWLFRKLRRNEEPWGGAQVIVVGDFLQLPPVRKGENTPYDWAFAHDVWKVSEFTPVILKEIRRQNEVNFIRALKATRSGLFDDTTREILRSRIKTHPSASIPRLYTHNVQVDKWNGFMLGELDGEAIVCEGVPYGDPKNAKFIAENLICPQRLELKIGAVVMTTINEKDGAYVNGSLGTVVDVVGDIQFPSAFLVKKFGGVGEIVEVRPFTWKHGKQHEDSYAEYTQFPMRLAYAMTIHKCQGLTLDTAYVDVRAAREHGQAYVALSRVRTLEGLLLKEWFHGVYVSDQAVNFYRDIGAS